MIQLDRTWLSRLKMLLARPGTTARPWGVAVFRRCLAVPPAPPAAVARAWEEVGFTKPQGLAGGTNQLGTNCHYFNINAALFDLPKTTQWLQAKQSSKRIIVATWGTLTQYQTTVNFE
eukprot:GHVT01076134.1.p1 GENE.GHVT01076134.1~~GHVT01076134.1.p1  ORF type:complete len:118 (+),score=10.98 GHVT01076134.1:391-744(+)